MSVQTHRPDELGHDYLEIRGLTVDFDGFKPDLDLDFVTAITDRYFDGSRGAGGCLGNT